jgi:hypothetical protein
MYAMYYASTLRCWQLVGILVGTNHPCLRVGCHRKYFVSLSIEFVVQLSTRHISSSIGDSP